MTETATATAPWLEEAAAIRLGTWLSARFPAVTAQRAELVALTGGTSGSVMLVKAGDWRAVLRTVAWPARPDSINALQREARVLEALEGTDVPHPGFLAYCEDESVIGAPFCLMAFVEGWMGAGAPPAEAGWTQDDLHARAFAMVEGLAALSRVDVAAVGLSDFGRPDNFLERQVDRWQAQMERHRSHPEYGDRQLPGWDELAEWLRAHTPQMQRVSIIHGDLSFSNIMFTNESPARLAAIIDWEIATLGDPLLDLGRALYPFPSETGAPGYSLAVNLDGYPSRESLARRYSELSGLGIENLRYYMALSMFKLAALIEFNHVKSLREGPGSLSHRLSEFIPRLVQGALEIARQG
ncbi:MAG: phosphotransferase family protein [Hyphomicrobiaceae bacterium]